MDIPVTKLAKETLDEAAFLNPSDITITKPGWFFGYPTQVSLADILAPVVKDTNLENSFKTCLRSMDEDEVSQTVQDSYAEALFGEGEFEKAGYIKK